MRVNLGDKEKEIVLSLLEHHVPEFEVRVFGSRLSTDIKPHSDLDLVIVTNGGLSVSRLAKLKYDFTESDLPFKVDVLDWSEVSESFKELIEQNYAVIKKAK